jgi:hypothetical protein
MKYKSRLIITIALFIINYTTVPAQGTVAASGGNFSGSKGSVSYTIGQVAFTTASSTNNSVTQGIQQSYDISVVTAIENTSDITMNWIVYPNPTRNSIKLSIGSGDFDKVHYRLFDINGRKILDNKIENEESEILMNNLVPSIYLLKVIRNEKEVKTFKIIKY